MHIGRPLMMLKQYLDLRLAAAVMWKRVAVTAGLLGLCLALIPIGLLIGHYVLVIVGVILALGIVVQGAGAIRHRRRADQSDLPSAPADAVPGEESADAPAAAAPVPRQSLP